MKSASTTGPGTYEENAVFLCPEIDVVNDIPAELEDFILLSRLGLFKDANEMFETNLKPYRDTFPVFMEYADMLFASRRFFDLITHLDNPPLQEPLSKSEDCLCHLMRLLAEYYMRSRSEESTLRRKESASRWRDFGSRWRDSAMRRKESAAYSIQVALDAARSWHDKYQKPSDEFDEIDSHITEIYLEIIISASFRRPSWRSSGDYFLNEEIDDDFDDTELLERVPIDPKYYQPPGLPDDKSYATDYDGFIERCEELNKQERYWEAQRIFTLLLPTIPKDQVEPFFQRYLHDLDDRPLSAERAVARLAACSAFLGRARNLDSSVWINRDGIVSASLVSAINIAPSLSYLFQDMKAITGYQFKTWKSRMLDLIVKISLIQEKQVMSLLLEAVTGYGQPPLFWALEKGQEEVCKYILDHHGSTFSNDERESLPSKAKKILLDAAKNGYETILKCILDNGKVDPNVQDEEGQTALIWAAKNGHEAIIKFMLKIDGVNPDLPDIRQWTPLSWAACQGHSNIVQILLDCPGVDPDSTDKNGRTPLSWAASKAHTSVVQTLLADERVDANYMDTYSSTPLFWAINKENEESAGVLLQRVQDFNAIDTNSRNLLSYAAEKGLETIVRQLLNCVRDTNAQDDKGRTPLSYAAEKGHLSISELLLEKADFDKRDSQGLTPLAYASIGGHEAVVQLLLQNADPKITDNGGSTAFMHAAGRGHVAVVQLLLEKVDPDSKDHRGWTALMHASRNGHVAVVQLLLESGRVDPTWTAPYNWTALRCARLEQHRSIVDLLNQYL